MKRNHFYDSRQKRFLLLCIYNLPMKELKVWERCITSMHQLRCSFLWNIKICIPKGKIIKIDTASWRASTIGMWSKIMPKIPLMKLTITIVRAAKRLAFIFFQYIAVCIRHSNKNSTEASLWIWTPVIGTSIVHKKLISNRIFNNCFMLNSFRLVKTNWEKFIIICLKIQWLS